MLAQGSLQVHVRLALSLYLDVLALRCIKMPAEVFRKPTHVLQGFNFYSHVATDSY